MASTGCNYTALQFMLSSALQKSRLHALLAGENFIDVFRPSVTEFDLLLNALAGELEELGSKMHKITGENL